MIDVLLVDIIKLILFQLFIALVKIAKSCHVIAVQITVLSQGVFGPSLQTRHVILLLCQFVNYLEVVRLPVYVGTQKEYAEPELYANNVRTLMAAEVRGLLFSEFLMPHFCCSYWTCSVPVLLRSRTSIKLTKPSCLFIFEDVKASL